MKILHTYIIIIYDFYVHANHRLNLILWKICIYFHIHLIYIIYRMLKKGQVYVCIFTTYLFDKVQK